MDNIREKPTPGLWHIWMRTLMLGTFFILVLIAVARRFVEIGHVIELLRQADPRWLLFAVFLQMVTYASVAMVWTLIFRVEGVGYPFFSLMPLAVSKLFADQILPSGGISGIAFFVTALKKRGLQARLCIGVMLVSIVTYYVAYGVVAAISIIILVLYHQIHTWIIVIAIFFSVAAVAIPAVVLLLRQWSGLELPLWLARLPGIANIAESFSDAPAELLMTPKLLFSTTLFQISVFVLDAATLWVMLMALGQYVSFWVALPAFIMASIVAMLSLIPLGLGSFEAACVAMLVMLGVHVEAALTATLLLRGITLWFPMIPGLWLMHRELR